VGHRPNALFGPELKRTFATTGVRTLTLEATYGSGRRTANLFVDVRNTAPTVNLSYAGTAYVGVAFPMTALISDVNEADGSALCSRTTWSVDAPDALAAATGCAQQVTFGATGSRQVRVSTVDNEGATGVRNVTLDVQPAPANPYPQVTSYGVYARDALFIDGTFIGCGDLAPWQRARPWTSGRTAARSSSSARRRRSASAPRSWSRTRTRRRSRTTGGRSSRVGGVDTTINTVVGSASATFVPYSPGNAIDVTNDCRVTVTVNAPDPARSKSLTVWAGKCTYWSTRLN
jgi:hypothetical protein